MAREVLRQTRWPPDLFAALFDLLDANTVWQSVQNIFIPANRDPLSISDEEATLRGRLKLPHGPSTKWEVSETFCELALSAINDMEQWIAQVPRLNPVNSEFPRRIAYLARAIDVEAIDLSLHRKSLLCDKFQEAHDLLHEKQTFTRIATGRVIPAAARCARGNAARKFFKYLLRISPGTDNFVSYRIGSSLSKHKAGEPLRIGVIPTVQHRDEVSWGLSSGRYTVSLNSKHESKVIRRVIRGLEWLLTEEAHVIIIPELVSSELLRNAVSCWLRDKAPNDPLLILCGSEAVKSDSATGRTNRAFVVGASGRPLWTQDKNHQYALNAKQIGTCGLQRVLGREDRNEISTSMRSEVVICDLLGSGRFSVFVCEDFARDEPGLQALRTFEVDMGVVAVMDGQFTPGEWRQRGAHTFAQEPGSRIAIGNSRALISRLSDRDRRNAKVDDLANYTLPNHGVTQARWFPNGPLSRAIALLIAPEVKI